MPSASISSHASMSQLVRDTYQANGLIRSHQQPATASSQTSLQKLPPSSPQFMYQFSNNNNNNSQQQSMMQFHPQPAGGQAPLMAQSNSQQKPLDGNALAHYNQMLGTNQQQQQTINNLALNNMLAHHQQQNPGQTLNGAMNGTTGPSNSNNLIQPTILMQPLMSAKNSQLYSSATQQHQSHQQALYNAPYLHQQQMQLATNNSQQSLVPLTTIMVPASIASQLQSLSIQIQQAAMQTTPNLHQNPQIMVFMVPYMASNSMPNSVTNTTSITPEQASQNSTLVRQSHSNSSMMRHQAQVQQQQKQQHQVASSSHTRVVSSLSNNTLTGPVAGSSAALQTSNQQTVAPNSDATARQHQHKEPEKFYIKANFTYQPSRQPGDSRLSSNYRQQTYRQQELAFRKGDILHVLDTLLNNDLGAQYWLATRVKPNGEDAEKGLIPNKNKAEEITIEQRTMDIGERGVGASGSNGASGSMANGTNGILESSSVLSASVGRVNFLKRRSAQRSKSLCKDNWDNVVFDIGNFRMQTYERVVYKHPGFCRPVVIFGPLSDLARQKLLKDYPEKYSYPAGLSQSPDHPKVIRLKGILDVIDQGKHALLDITAQAVERLNYVNLAPIVIFMKTESKSVIKEFRSRAAKSLDPNARDEDTLRRDGKSSRKLLEQSVKLEKQWFHVFTAILDLSSMGSEMWYRKLRETIENQQSANVWMGEKKSEKKLVSSNTNAGSLMGVSDGNPQALYQSSGRSAHHLASGAPNLNDQLHSQQQQQLQPQPQPHTMADSASMLNEKFSECLNLTTTKSHNDLMPQASMDAGLYGNRSQLRNAYAHSLAQKLARASSEPKLNGMMSDQDDDLDQDEDLGGRLAGGCIGMGDDDDDDEYDDEELIKKPLFPGELENSSSISSSNGIGGGAGTTSFGPSSLQGTSSSSQAQLQQHPCQQLQHASSSYQILPSQALGKPPAPLPPQVAAQQQQHEQSMDQQHMADHQHQHQLNASRSFMAQVQESIYSMNGSNAMVDPTSLMGNSSSSTFAPGANSTNGQSLMNVHQQQQQQQQQQSLRNNDYHPLPPMPTSESVYNHSSQLQPPTMHQISNQKGAPNSSSNNINPPTVPNNHANGHSGTGGSHNNNPNSNGNSNNVIDLSRASGHDTRGSAYQIYSDMNQNNYHYYNMNKI